MSQRRIVPGICCKLPDATEEGMGALRVVSLVCTHQENPSAPKVRGYFMLYSLKIYCSLQ